MKLYVKLLIGVLALQVLQLSTSVVVSQSLVPPQFWCDTPETASAVGVTNECNQYAKAAFGKKVNITLLWEALCPDCHQFILEVLLPQWNDFKDIVNLELVPFGNARESPGPHGSIVTTCQHGAVECSLNQVSTCAVNYIRKMDLLLPFIQCIVQTGGASDPETTMEDCFKEKIRNCWDTPLGASMEHKMALRTQNVWPTQHEFVPWILVDNVSTFGIQNAIANSKTGFASVVCSAYRGPQVQVCDNNLKTTNG